MREQYHSLISQHRERKLRETYSVCAGWPHRKLEALSTPPLAPSQRFCKSSRRNAAWGSISPGAQIAESCTAQQGLLPTILSAQLHSASAVGAPHALQVSSRWMQRLSQVLWAGGSARNVSRCLAAMRASLCAVTR